MKKNSLVSVIMPVYNGEHYLNKAMQSLLNQDYDNMEIIIVDDGSNDNTASIIKHKYKKKVTYIYQKNAGVASARNRGITEAKGYFIAFLDQDDYWYEHKLACQMLYMQKKTDIDVLSCQQHTRLAEGIEKPAWLRQKVINDDSLGGYLPSSLLIRKEVFSRIGKFNETFVNSSDTEWLSRIKKEGVTHKKLNKTLFCRMIHSDNTSHDTATTHQELFRLLRNRKK